MDLKGKCKASFYYTVLLPKPYVYFIFLGKRRQYQQEMLSQLVLHIEQHTKTAIQPMSISQEKECIVTNVKHTDIDPMSDILPCIQTK
jgi:hypothetical protein